MEGLLGLLVAVIVLGVIFYVLYWAVSQIPLPAPFDVVVRVLLALIVVVVLLGLLFGNIGIPGIRLR